MTTTETNIPATRDSAADSTFAAGAEIYRRLERPSRGPSVPLLIALIATFVGVTGGVIAYQLQPGSTPPAAQSTNAP